MAGNCNLKVAHMRPQVLGLHNFLCSIFFGAICWEQLCALQHNFEFNRKNKVRHWLQLRGLNITTYSHLKSTWKFELKCIVKIRRSQQGQIVLCKKKSCHNTELQALKICVCLWKLMTSKMRSQYEAHTETSMRLSSTFGGKVQSPLFQE